MHQITSVTRFFLFKLPGTLAMLFCVMTTAAQTVVTQSDFPNREVRVVVPVEPGGGIDNIARLMAQQLSSQLKQTFLVVNRSGADGTIGTVSVARSAPDGLTLLATGLGHISTPLLRNNAGYDPIRDFEPVAQIAVAPNVLLVHASLKDLSVSQLLRATGKDGKGLAYGSAGIGHTSHLAAGLFMARTGVQWLHVPYRGTAPALRALMSGEVQVVFAPVSSLAAALASNRVHAMAIAHPTRVAEYPALPTLAELGVKGADFAQWYALFAPASTPANILDSLSISTMAAAKADPIAKYIAEQGMQPSPLNRQAFTLFLRAERERLSELITRMHIVQDVK